MSNKKKLGMGVVSAVLGLALIGGGTWAAFNDIERVGNTLASGTLDLGVSHEILFELENLKPGDTMTRQFEITNEGSLAIKEVLLSASYDEETFDGNGTNESALDFLDQFQIELLTVSQYDGAPVGDPNFYIIDKSHGVTLKDLVEGTLPSDVVTVDGQINLAPHNSSSPEWSGITVDPADDETVIMQLTFIDDKAKDADGYYLQNKYQGNYVDFTFVLEATQWHGIDVEENGYVNENERANPQPENGNPIIINN